MKLPLFCFCFEGTIRSGAGYVGWWRRWRIWAGLGDGEAIGVSLGAQVQVTQSGVITEYRHFLQQHLSFLFVTGSMFTLIPIPYLI
jgi:hypothetical protein